ncbi:MAG: hypothetical protein JRF63_09630 [Deltaproteobacteria bacterium]|nr:hypothetical protein [Deltaproteobacteria bacterium]
MNWKDKRLLVFGALNLVQGALVGAIPLLVSSRAPHVDWALIVAAILMLVAGPGLVFGGSWGRRFAAVVCLLHWVIGLAAAALLASSASYLYGIYGHHGHAVGSLAAVMAVMVLIVFWLIPAHELAYLRGRGAAR